jgi:hypothetical protein
MKFKPFQIHDYAAAAMVDGLVLAHDTGLGKSLAALTWPLLKCGFKRSESGAIEVQDAVLVVAPGDLHDQLRNEAKKFYNIKLTTIPDQAALLRLLSFKDGKATLPPGFYITSYTRLAVNGVKKLSALENLRPEIAIQEMNLTLADLQTFYDLRGVNYRNDYAELGVTPSSTRKQIENALSAKLRACRDIADSDCADARRAQLLQIHAILVNFLDFAPAPFAEATDSVKFVWRALIRRKLEEFSQGVGEFRTAGDGPSRSDIRCVYSPSMADLCSHLFKCVVIDEGVKMKGADTQVGKGIRQMCPNYRLVLTATPVKNRLPDIFWLAWWAAGGHEEATARWPYAGGAEEQGKFADTLMLQEFNKTQAEESGKGRSRFTKLRPEICNLHLLWKALGPIVLRRRKQDIGQSIVQKIRQVYRVPMGLHQRAVYQYHLEAEYLDKNYKPAPGAKLQALRVAAAAPDSHLLERQPDAVGLHRSPHSFTPKVACALTLIRDILQRSEQAAVFSAFNDPSDTLSRYLTEAGVDHYVLDGRMNQARRGLRSAAFNSGECPITLAGIDSMAEGHNWDNVNNVILTSYSWAADKFTQAISRVHRLTSRKDVNLFVVLCDQSADRVLEDNINEKTNSSELAIDGRLLGEDAEEKSMSELLRDAMRDFKSNQECPDEQKLTETWPALREQLRDGASAWCGREVGPEAQLEPNRNPIDLSTFDFPIPLAKPPESIPRPVQVNVPSWRRVIFAV